MGDVKLADIVKSHTLRTIREEFDEYILEDGNTLRIKDVLVSFGLGEITTTESDKKKAKTFIQFHQVISVIPTADVDTSHLQLQNRTITESDQIKEIKFTVKKNSLKLYETDEFLIIVRSRLNHVWTTPFKDKNEIPIYSLNCDVTLDTREKEELATFKDK